MNALLITFTGLMELWTQKMGFRLGSVTEYRDGTLIRQGALNSSIYKTLPSTIASSSAELNASKYDEIMSKKTKMCILGGHL